MKNLLSVSKYTQTCAYTFKLTGFFFFVPTTIPNHSHNFVYVYVCVWGVPFEKKFKCIFFL